MRPLCSDTAKQGHDTTLARAAHSCDMAGPSHDMTGPRLVTRPLGCHDIATRACLNAPVCIGWPRLCTWCTQPVFGLSTGSGSLFGRCS